MKSSFTVDDHRQGRAMLGLWRLAASLEMEKKHVVLGGGAGQDARTC